MSVLETAGSGKSGPKISPAKIGTVRSYSTYTRYTSVVQYSNFDNCSR